MLDVAQPVLHRRRPGHRGPRRASRAFRSSGNSDESAEREPAYLDLSSSSGSRSLITPFGTPGSPRRLRDAASRWSSSTARPGTAVLLGLGRRRRRRPARRRAPGGAVTSGWHSSADRPRSGQVRGADRRVGSRGRVGRLAVDEPGSPSHLDEVRSTVTGGRRQPRGRRRGPTAAFCGQRPLALGLLQRTVGVGRRGPGRPGHRGVRRHRVRRRGSRAA